MSCPAKLVAGIPCGELPECDGCTGSLVASTLGIADKELPAFEAAVEENKEDEETQRIWSVIMAVL